MVRTSHVLAFLALTFWLWSGHQLIAQSKKKGEAIVGTVVSVEKAKTGRSHILTMKTKSDETEYEVPIVPRTQLAILVPGDSAFLKPNAFVTGLVFPAENPGEFESPELTVYLGNPPPPQFKPAMKTDGTQPEEFEISGKVLLIQQGIAQIQCGQQTIKLLSADQVSIMVKHNDVTQIKDGDEVEIEGTIVKSKAQINASLVTVTSSGSIKADEFFATQGGKTAKTAGGKAKKDAAGASASKEPDPFGVLGGQAKAKTKTKSKTGAGSNAPGLKESDPFGVMNGEAKSKVKGKTGAVPTLPATKDADPFGITKNKAKTKAKAGNDTATDKEAEGEKSTKKPGTTTIGDSEKSDSKE